MIDRARMLLTRSENVLAQVRDDRLLTVVGRTDDCSTVLLVDVAEVFIELPASLDNQTSQENLQVISRWKFYVKSDIVLAQTERSHSTYQVEHLDDVVVLLTELL